MSATEPCTHPVLGDDRPNTLISANNLVRDLRALGEQTAARELEEWVHSQRGC